MRASQSQASFFGTGVCMVIAGLPRMLVEPRPYVAVRHTPARWWFAEEVFRRVGASGADPAGGDRPPRKQGA